MKGSLRSLEQLMDLPSHTSLRTEGWPNIKQKRSVYNSFFTIIQCYHLFLEYHLMVKNSNSRPVPLNTYHPQNQLLKLKVSSWQRFKQHYCYHYFHNIEFSLVKLIREVIISNLTESLKRKTDE